jgi:hypothetical protein
MGKNKKIKTLVESGFKESASGTLVNGYEVTLLGMPEKDVDGSVRVWVSMNFDPHVHFFADVEEITIKGSVS